MQSPGQGLNIPSGSSVPVVVPIPTYQKKQPNTVATPAYVPSAVPTVAQEPKYELLEVPTVPGASLAVPAPVMVAIPSGSQSVVNPSSAPKVPKLPTYKPLKSETTVGVSLTPVFTQSEAIAPVANYINKDTAFWNTGIQTTDLTSSFSSLYVSSLFAGGASISTLTNSTITTTSINIDGQTLDADSDQLFLNGIPIATTANLSSIQDWAIYDAISSVRMLNNDIVGAKSIYATNVSTLNCSASSINATNIEANYIDTNFILTNYASVSSIGGTNAVFSEVNVSTIQFNTTVGVGELSVNASATTLFFNGAPITTGTPSTPVDLSQWATLPAVSTIQCAGNSIDNVGSFTMPTSVLNSFNLGGGSILTPISQNNQYALNTRIVNVSPLTPMEITSAGGINLTANATTGTQEFNISFVGTTGNDMNITAPDINLTCTDATSFMNLTAPAGVTIAGGGLFIASGVIEAIGGGDITLLSAGNVSIGSGNVAGADTEIEKFAFSDCNVEPTNGINHLKLNQIEVINVRRDAGSEGIFVGDFKVGCQQATTYTIQSYNSNAQQVVWQVQTDQGTSVYKAMNLTSLGSNQPIRMNMSANGNTFTTTYDSGNLVSYTTTGGDVQLAGVGTINASSQLSAPVGSFSNLNISSLNTFNISSATIGVSSIVGNYGSFNTLRTGATNIALGSGAGISSQQVSTVAIGANAGALSQTTFGVAIGSGAGYQNQGSWGLAIGTDAGGSNQGNGAVAIGLQCGRYGQKVNSVAIGNVAGYSNQQQYTVALGLETGQWNQGENAVAVGWQAGQSNQGSNSVAIGYGACAVGGSFANTLVLNATGVAVNPTKASACFIAPVAQTTDALGYQTSMLRWNATTKEVSYAPQVGSIQVIATSGTAINLVPTAYTKTFILTGTTTQAFTTTSLTANDAGYYVYLKNGNATNGGDITITGATNNTIVHEPKTTQNSGILILYWNGTGLVGY